MNVLPDMPVLSQTADRGWYKDVIIYQLHVKAFADSNDDGIGDFNGLTSRLDYLQDLGVTALWLLPFYPSPGRDDGYDIADYRRINPAFGSMQDFRRFMAAAKQRGLRIITELVINHTSDQHPWFKHARRSRPGSNARNWYVWSDTDQRYLGTRIIFTDTEKSNWAWDPVAGQYYWHRFFSHQPDLNFANPQVFSAITQVMRRWLDSGVDGFRLDAIPYLCEREGTSSENIPETHDIIKRLRAEVDAYAPDTVLLAEANQWPEDVSAYFGNGDECHMAYHFPLMPRIYMAIAQEDRFPITDILRQTPDIPANCQWALFLRNHDELTLEMVTDSERDYLWSTYASDPQARINLGIRRRLAPLMENDRRKIELMNSLLLSFPGTPILYYGDEIGMGDNIYLGDRNGVRTPMQWTPDRNGGFSRCDPAKLYLPPIMDAVYGYQAVNVEAQSRSLSSLLSWTKRMVAVRKTSQAFGRGTLAFIRPSNRAVLAYVREYNGEVILCVANLSRSAQAVELDLSAWVGRAPIEMMGRSRFAPITDRPFPITLAPYGFFWLLLCEQTEGSADIRTHAPEWVTLVFNDGWRSLSEGRGRYLLERDVLPPFLASRRWFAHKQAGAIHAKLEAAIPWTGDANNVLAIVSSATGPQSASYALPLKVQWKRLDRNSDEARTLLVAAVRRANLEGDLLDASTDPDVVRSLIGQIHRGGTLDHGSRRIVFSPSEKFARSSMAAVEDVRASHGEQSNTTVLVGTSYVLKLYRKLSTAPSPEVEMGRFLTDNAGFTHSPALLGSIELAEGSARASLAVLHELIENQGDGWSFTGNYLDRYLDEKRLLAASPGDDPEPHAAFANRLRVIGRRVGELHNALSSRPDVPAFAPKPMTSSDGAGWTDALVASASAVFDRLAAKRLQFNDQTRALVDRLIGRREIALDHLRSLLPADVRVSKIRHHGDLHLGQILIVKDDAAIIDFEGEPQRAGHERRSKAPAARDVAGMIRSLDYAAVSAVRRFVKPSPEEEARLAALVDLWRKQSTEAFYAGVRAVSDASLWPQDENEAQQLLRFFIAEKAIYEIEYELANRPDWLALPLSGALRAIFGDGEGGA